MHRRSPIDGSPVQIYIGARSLCVEAGLQARAKRRRRQFGSRRRYWPSFVPRVPAGRPEWTRHLSNSWPRTDGSDPQKPLTSGSLGAAQKGLASGAYCSVLGVNVPSLNVPKYPTPEIITAPWPLNFPSLNSPTYTPGEGSPTWESRGPLTALTSSTPMPSGRPRANSPRYTLPLGEWYVPMQFVQSADASPEHCF